MDQPLWQRLRDDSIAVPGRRTVQLAEHRLIAAAIVDRDPAAARFTPRSTSTARAATWRSTRRTDHALPRHHPRRHHPFDADGAVDVDALARNVAALLEAGVHGFVATGTMGEAGCADAAERRAVIEAVVRAAGGSVPVIVGVSAGATAAAIAHAAPAADAGADALMCLPPLNYRGDEREIAAFYARRRRGHGLPIMAYNNPAASGIDLSPELIARLAAEVAQVVAVKECSRRRAPHRRAARTTRPTSRSSSAATTGRSRASRRRDRLGLRRGERRAGASASSCRARAGRPTSSEARAVYARLLPLARLDMTPKLVQYFKGAMDAVGLTGGPCRAPRLAARRRRAARCSTRAVEALGRRVAA